jgi:hypothetical protein
VSADFFRPETKVFKPITSWGIYIEATSITVYADGHILILEINKLVDLRSARVFNDVVKRFLIIKCIFLLTSMASGNDLSLPDIVDFFINVKVISPFILLLAHYHHQVRWHKERV